MTANLRSLAKRRGRLFDRRTILFLSVAIVMFISLALLITLRKDANVGARGRTVTVIASTDVKEATIGDKNGEEPEDIKDIADPVNLPVDYSPYIRIGAGAVALIGAGVAAYILLRCRERKVEEAPPRPAHEIAYEQLREIAAAKLIEAGEIDRYYVLLSGVIRHYLENRFNLHAPEMTTEEFLQAAASVETRHAVSLHGHRELLRDFLTECDLVKFAQYGPDKGQMQAAFESAKRFVDETRADLVEVQ